MNKLGKIAKMLGVDLGQEFNVNENTETYKLTVNGIYKKEGTDWTKNSYSLILLLTGELSLCDTPRLTDDEKEHLRVLAKNNKTVSYVMKIVRRHKVNKQSFCHLAFYDDDKKALFGLPNLESKEDYKRLKANKFYKVEELIKE